MKLPRHCAVQVVVFGHWGLTKNEASFPPIARRRGTHGNACFNTPGAFRQSDIRGPMWGGNGVRTGIPLAVL